MPSRERQSPEKKGLPLGVLLLNSGLVTPGQLLDALGAQAQDTADGRRPRRIGDVLIAQGKITRQQVDDLLKRQKAELAEARKREAAPPASTDLPAAPLNGPTIFGKFMLLRALSRGSTGVVYEALDSDKGKKVALKLFFPEAGDEKREKSRERFLREARVSTRLPPHPNIVRVYEAGITRDRRFLAMEFVEGRDMAEWMREGPLPLRRQIALLADVARAVHHTHEHGILHRDLKPKNIVVDTEGRPRIADFGLAKSERRTGSEPLTISGMLLGTPAYMSPEQAQGEKEIDRRTDVYSLGVILYEILTGQIPFGERATVMTLMKIVSEPPPPPSSVLRGKKMDPVDARLEDACLKAMGKLPGDRHPTALAFAEDLAAWLKS